MTREFSDLQRRVAEFVEKRDLEAPVQARALDLISEVGELAKEVLKGTGYGRGEFDTTRDWEDELGDVFFSLVCLANSTGVDLEAGLNGSLNKYRERFGASNDAGSGR